MCSKVISEIIRLANATFVVATLVCCTGIILVALFADRIGCRSKLSVICYSVEAAQYLVTIYLCYLLRKSIEKREVRYSKEST